MKPKEIKIGPHIFQVEYTTGLVAEGSCGKCDATSLKIFINTSFPKSIQEETIIHECLHAIRYITGTELKDSEEEERVVQALSPCLLEVFRQLKFSVNKKRYLK